MYAVTEAFHKSNGYVCDIVAITERFSGDVSSKYIAERLILYFTNCLFGVYLWVFFLVKMFLVEKKIPSLDDTMRIITILLSMEFISINAYVLSIIECVFYLKGYCLPAA